MNTTQQNKLSMYLTVNSLCRRSSYEPIWSGLVAFGTNLNAFAERIEVIETLGRIQSTPKEGITAEKAKLRGWLIDSTLEVAGAIRAYAAGVDNRDLRAKVDLSRSELEDLRDVEVDDRAQAVHDLATEHLAGLGDFGVTPAKLANLLSRIDAFTAAAQSPRTVQVEGRSITSSLIEQFRAADSLLKNGIDPLMLQFKSGSPDFYNAYQAARMVVDQPATHESPGSAAPATPTV